MSSNDPDLKTGQVITVIFRRNYKFSFPARIGFGCVKVHGWHYLVSFNCPEESRECSATELTIAESEVIKICREKTYLGLPAYEGVPLESI